VSVITIEVDCRAHIPSVVRVARPITGLSMGAIRQAVEMGAPIFERELFLNNFAEVADSLRMLINGLGKIDVPFVIRENGHEISPAVLNNILEGSEQFRL
jgi:hypothetical protein